MTFMYRITLDCAHFFLHGPAKNIANFYIGEAAVCLICPPLRNIIKEASEDGGDWVYPTRTIVNVEEIDSNKVLPFMEPKS
jgi:hypothetical protein